MMKKFLFPLLSLLAAALFPVSAHGQYLGQVSLQTVNSTPFNNVTCTGVAQQANVPNLGQTSHYATLNSPTTGIQQFSMQFFGSTDGANFVPISDTISTPIQGASAVAQGQYAIVQMRVTCAPAGQSFTIGYAGTSATPTKEYGNYLVSAVNKELFQLAVAGSNATSPQNSTPFGSSAGFISFAYQTLAGPSGSTVTVSCFGNANSPGAEILYGPFNLLVNAGLVQIFQVPSNSCPLYKVAYTSGGASTVNYILEYNFTPPGYTFGLNTSAASLTSPLNLSATIIEKGPRWQQLSTPAVSTQASASKPAGGVGVRHVADCVSFSAGSTTAPALTQLTINLRDGASGAGTVLNSWTVIIPANTGQNVTPFSVCGFNQIGSINTAMTLEFSALLTNLFENVTLTGYDVQ